MSVRFERGAGAALAALLVVHVVLRPEHGWVLLWGCDASAAAIAIGLLAGAYRLFAVGALFQIAIGLPAFIVGLATTYVPNVTGVGVHTLPPIISAVVIARRGLPGRPAIAAAAGYLGLMGAGYLFAPVAQNVNFSRSIFPPLARVFSSLLPFWIFHVTSSAIVLLLGEALLRRLVRRAAGHQEGSRTAALRAAPASPPDQ